MEKVTEEKIAKIKNQASKPTMFNGIYPLNDLSDREFETLCYIIFRERIKYDDKELSGIAEITSVALVSRNMFITSCSLPRATIKAISSERGYLLLTHSVKEFLECLVYDSFRRFIGNGKLLLDIHLS